MTTPIYDFVNAYAAKKTIRAHMPGHKGYPPEAVGCGFGAAFSYDITEINGADSLFDADGIIAESEKNASRLFGTAATFYSAGGSTLCIQAMLAAVCGSGGNFICARNAHRSVSDASILLDLTPLWVYPEYEEGSAVSGKLTPEAVERAIEKYAALDPACVFITSPDYLGRIAPVKKIAEVCHRHSLPLLVDNAHGAYLAFLEENRHPIALGADMCCDSAHKTLPVLTGGAYLHAGNGKYSAVLKRCMALFGSTSPSYLILESLDLCNKYLADGYRERLAETVNRIALFKEKFSHICVRDTEPLKIPFYAYSCGQRGYELAERLRAGGIETEYSDETHTVLMLSASNTREDIDKLDGFMERLPCPLMLITPPEPDLDEAERVMSPREAFFSAKETVPTENALGRTAAENVTVCPPCVPAVAAGERIDENIINILKMYSISSVNVVK